MRESHLIPVNGRFLMVVEDDTIQEDNVTTNAALAAGQYASDIYGIPLTVLGGYPVTFWEYFNHANAQELAVQQIVNGLTFTTDGGMFRWFVDFARGCLKLNAKFTPRLRMRTPQIAWRITNVAYQPLQHFRSWDPASTYFADGGVTEGGNPQYYSSWNPTTPATL
jgi:hypothetical protein